MCTDVRMPNKYQQSCVQEYGEQLQHKTSFLHQDYSIAMFVAEGQINIRKRRTNVTGLMIIVCLDAFNTKYANKYKLYPLPCDCPQDLVKDAKKYCVTFD